VHWTSARPTAGCAIAAADACTPTRRMTSPKLPSTTAQVHDQRRQSSSARTQHRSRSAAPPRSFAAEPEIHRVDPEFGSTLRLL
jgi:hypothetical protein